MTLDESAIANEAPVLHRRTVTVLWTGDEATVDDILKRESGSLVAEMRGRGAGNPAITVVQRDPYEAGVRDGITMAALMVRRHECATDLSLLASDIEDIANATDDPATCSHPFWLAPTPDGPVCRSCGADVSHLDPMGG